MAAHQNTIILFGGVSDDQKIIDDKLYLYKLDYKMWSVINLTGQKPTARINLSLTLIEQNHLFIFGGTSCAEKDEAQLFLIDLIKKDSKVIQIKGIKDFGARSLALKLNTIESISDICIMTTAKPENQSCFEIISSRKFNSIEEKFKENSQPDLITEEVKADDTQILKLREEIESSRSKLENLESQYLESHKEL